MNYAAVALFFIITTLLAVYYIFVWKGSSSNLEDGNHKCAISAGVCKRVELSDVKKVASSLILRNVFVRFDENALPHISVFNRSKAQMQSSYDCCSTQWMKNCDACHGRVSFLEPGDYKCKVAKDDNHIMYVANRWGERSVYHGVIDIYYPIWAHLREMTGCDMLSGNVCNITVISVQDHEPRPRALFDLMDAFLFNSKFMLHNETRLQNTSVCFSKVVFGVPRLYGLDHDEWAGSWAGAELGTDDYYSNHLFWSSEVSQLMQEFSKKLRLKVDSEIARACSASTWGERNRSVFRHHALPFDGVAVLARNVSFRPWPVDDNLRALIMTNSSWAKSLAQSADVRRLYYTSLGDLTADRCRFYRFLSRPLLWIGREGADFTNQIFLPPLSVMVEINPKDKHDDFFWLSPVARFLGHVFIQMRGVDDHSSPEEWSTFLLGATTLARQLQQAALRDHKPRFCIVTSYAASSPLACSTLVLYDDVLNPSLFL